MKILVLTSIGDSIAANPNNSNSTNYRVLAYLRRHGRQATDQQLLDHLMIDGNDLKRSIVELEKNQAVKTIVSN